MTLQSFRRPLGSRRDQALLDMLAPKSTTQLTINQVYVKLAVPSLDPGVVSAERIAQIAEFMAQKLDMKGCRITSFEFSTDRLSTKEYVHVGLFSESSLQELWTLIQKTTEAVIQLWQFLGASAQDSLQIRVVGYYLLEPPVR